MSKKTVIVRLKKDKNIYEVLVHHGTVEKYREGNLGWNKVLFADTIFKNSSKGDKYTDSQLKSAFGTSNIDECLKAIVNQGELQLTTADRKEKTEQLRRKITNEIRKYYVDPKTKTSYTQSRIEQAVAQTKVRIDLNTPFEKLLKEIIRKLPEFLPIRKMVWEGTLHIPHVHIGSVLGIIPAKGATIVSQSYTSIGCDMEISLVPGDFDVLMKELNNRSKGAITYDVAGESTSIEQVHNTKKLKKNKKAKNRQSNKNIARNRN